ncbi:hypothetical protein AB0E83_22145 [Streptomyces sp. NPDC035033]|uniref:hypothetical protein n=1 Tax=Streptomyces sp. NPDC035033 TaxID=3155368 RepID=UPI0033FD7473
MALCVRLGAYDVHPEIEANTRAVARALVDTVAEVRERVTSLDGLRVEARMRREPGEARTGCGANRARWWPPSSR